MEEGGKGHVDEGGPPHRDLRTSRKALPTTITPDSVLHRGLSYRQGEDMTLYRIKRPDGLYSNGGASPCFKRNGKIWLSVHNLHHHLGLVSDRGRIHRYEDCVVEVCHFGPENWETDPLVNYIPRGGGCLP